MTFVADVSADVLLQCKATVVTERLNLNWTLAGLRCSISSLMIFFWFFLHSILFKFLRSEATFSGLLAHKYSPSYLCLLATIEIPFPDHILFNDFIDLLYQTFMTYD